MCCDRLIYLVRLRMSRSVSSTTRSMLVDCGVDASSLNGMNEVVIVDRLSVQMIERRPFASGSLRFDERYKMEKSRKQMIVCSPCSSMLTLCLLCL